MARNFGNQNEIDLVNALDKKFHFTLNPNLKNFIQQIFSKTSFIKPIHAYLIDAYLKPDIAIEYNKEKRYVSIKSIKSNTMHEEEIKEFILFLRKYGISEKTQKTILYYHYGDGTMNGTGKVRLSYHQIREKLFNDIKEANKELNANRVLVRAIMIRACFLGTNDANPQADCIYVGDVNDGKCFSLNQALLLVKHDGTSYMDNLHIGPFILRPHARYANKPVINEEYRHKIALYWPTLLKDADYMNKHYPF